jgi:hypothetical protein
VHLAIERDALQHFLPVGLERATAILEVNGALAEIPTADRRRTGFTASRCAVAGEIGTVGGSRTCD